MFNLRLLAFCIAIAFVVGLTFSTAAAQQTKCLPPVTLPAVTQPNMFPGEKEIWLGDAFAEQIQKDYRLIEDPVLTSYLSRIGERLAKNLPLNDLKFRFYLVDLPDANAFGMAGGRIYVSRKLVAFVQNEDELAGVISHELGHMVTHELAVDWTEIFQKVLGVSEVKDRKDLFEKYNLVIESLKLKSDKIGRHDREERGQLAADQAGFYALLSAGYDPTALARFWDRFTESKGKTGSWFSDLFGTTKPEAKRLREMLRQVNALPAECRGAVVPTRSPEFLAWQQGVVEFSGTGRAAALHGVVATQKLAPALRSDIWRVRFSPNGKLILAQDDSGLTVLTREPFEPILRIPTLDAYEARFSPDSQFVIIPTANLRVERWSVADKKMVEAREIFVVKGCLQTELSPDGKYLACINSNYDLQLIEVSTGKTALQKNEFYRPSLGDWWRILIALSQSDDENGDLNIHLINMHFSPDGRYFAAAFFGKGPWRGSAWEDQAVVLEVNTLSKVSVSDTVKHMMAAGFTFLDNQRIAGIYSGDEKKSGVVSFPDGKMLTQVPLWRWQMEPPTKGDFLLIRPIKDYALGVMDLHTQKFTKVSERSALDIYDDVYVSELRGGQLGLYRWNEPIASVNLPDSNLGRLWGTAISPDVRWLAMSGRSRGGLWNIKTGKQAINIRAFRGAHFDASNNFYADFPEYETEARNIAKFDSATGEVTPGAKIEAKQARQIGPYLTVVRSAQTAKKDKQKPAPEEKKSEKEDQKAADEKKKKADDEEEESGPLNRNVIYSIHDSTTMALLWSKTFPDEAPWAWVAPGYGTAAMVWTVQSDVVKSLIKTDAKMAGQLAALKEKDGDYFVQILDVKTGAERGRLFIETGKGSFRLSRIFAAGDWVLVADDQNRVLLYSLSTGALKGRAFGGFATISLETKLLCVENEFGKLTLYDLETMEKRDEFVFPGTLALVEFTNNGRRLFVLARDQTVYQLDISAAATSAKTN